MLELLSQAGARVVAFDMLFSERDIERVEPSQAESDGSFASAISASKNAGERRERGT